MSDADPQPKDPMPAKPPTPGSSTPEPSTPELSMPEPSTPELSMEEIIASISRIMAEDNRPVDPMRAAAEKRGILELTEAIEADGSVRRLTPAAASSSASAEAGREPSSESPAARLEPEPASPDPGIAGKSGLPPERILSAATSGAAASAFARLGAVPRERRTDGDLPLGAAGRTLEEIVRDTLRPLLQAWLDEHLPGIVERLVRDAIARVVGEAGLR
jgi:uncharacterized protein